MPYLICYDIGSNTLRVKISDRLVEAGLERINLSVFLGPLRSLTPLENWCRAELTARGDPARDSIVYLSVTDAQINGLTVIGRNDWDPDELTGQKTTLIL